MFFLINNDNNIKTQSYLYHLFDAMELLYSGLETLNFAVEN